MSIDLNIISRKELKFVISDHDLLKFNRWLFSKKKIIPIFETRKINSIYYDEINLQSAIDNLSGIEERKKYRIRWYGDNDISKINFELKQKINQYSKKITLKTDFLLSEINIQNFFNLNSPFVNRYKELIIKLIKSKYLEPTLDISYSRSYYIYNDIRLTFDKNIKYKLLKTNEIREDMSNILEIKFHEKKIDLVKNLLNDFDFEISRNSKYLKGLYYFDIIDYF